MTRHFEKGDVRRRQIAEAALSVIAEEGLGRFTVRAVADRLPITDGTIFRHFRNKEEIVLEAMSVLEEELFNEEMIAEKDPSRRLKAFFTTRAVLLGGPRVIGRLVLSEELAHAAGPLGTARVATWRLRSVAFVKGCLAEMAERGELRTDLAVDQLVKVTLGLLQTFAAERIQQSLTNDIESRVEQTWGTLQILLTQGSTCA